MWCCKRSPSSLDKSLEENYRDLHSRAGRKAHVTLLFHILTLIFSAGIPTAVSIWLYTSPQYSLAASTINLITPILVWIIYKFDFGFQASECNRIRSSVHFNYRRLKRCAASRSPNASKVMQDVEMKYHTLSDMLYASSFSLPGNPVSLDIHSDEDMESDIELGIQPRQLASRNSIIQDGTTETAPRNHALNVTQSQPYRHSYNPEISVQDTHSPPASSPVMRAYTDI